MVWPGNDPSCTPLAYSAREGLIDPDASGAHMHKLCDETGDAAGTIAVQLLPRTPLDRSRRRFQRLSLPASDEPQEACWRASEGQIEQQAPSKEVGST
jgi:hypothetical protein